MAQTVSRNRTVWTMWTVLMGWMTKEMKMMGDSMYLDHSGGHMDLEAGNTAMMLV